MSLNGITQPFFPLTIDGTQSLSTDALYVDGVLFNPDQFVPYTGANKTIDANSQIIKTTHIATTNPEVVNKQLLDSTISNLVVSIAGSFLDKVTTTPQTVIGDVTYTAQLTADNLVVPATKVANIGTVVEVGPNYKQAVNDASVTVGQYFGTITNSLGVYQSTSSQDMGTVILGAALTVGQRYRVYINVLGSDTSDTNVVMYQSSNGTTFNASIVSEYFNANSTIFRVMNQTFTASYPYVILALFTAGGGATLKWFGLERYEVGVELEKVTLPLLTASKVPILNDKKQLVASGTDASKLDYLDNVGSDIQTQLNSKLNLSGSNANQNIIIGSYKVQSSATPSTGDDYTNKTYVDSGLALKASLAANQTFTGTNTFSSSLPIVLSSLTPSRVLQLSGSAVVQASSVTTTELGYLSGVSSAIQTQIDSKASTSYVNTQDALRVLKTGDTMTGILTNSIANPYADRATNPLPSYNIVASSNSQRLYMGSYYTAGQGACATIQSSDYYSGLDHGTSLLINPLGGSVGIGTSDVLGVFNIYHDGSTQFLTLQNATFSSGQYVSLRFMFGKNNAANVSSYIRSYLDSNDATDLRFYTDDGGGFAEQMRITDEGYVGIGNTAPDVQLDVFGKGKFHNGTVGAPANGINGGDGTRLVLWPGNAGACPYALGINGGTLWYGTPSTATHRWYDGTTSMMTLNGAGLRVGPVVSPISNYEGNTLLVTYGNTCLYRNRLIFSDAIQDWNHSIYNNGLNLDGQGAWDGMKMNVFSGLWVRTGNANGVTPTTALFVDSSARLGIGTTTPSYRLDVNGTGRIRNELYVGTEGNAQSTIFMGGTAGDVAYDNCVIENRNYSGAENTELLLFKGNDNSNGSGPDRIRLRAAEIMFDTYDGATSNRTAENIRMRVKENGFVSIANYNPYQFTTGLISRAGQGASLAIASGNEGSNATLYLGTPFDPTSSGGSAYRCAIIANALSSWSSADLHFCVNVNNGSNDASTSVSVANTRMRIRTTGQISLGSQVGQTLVGVMGGVVTGNVSNTGAWPVNANGILISEDAQNQNTAGLYLGNQANTGYITSLAPGVAWLPLSISAGNTFVNFNGVQCAYTNAAGWQNVSDEREKEDIQDLKTDKSLSRVMALKPKHYRRKYYELANPVPQEVKEKRHIGFIAQEVQESNSHCVSTWCNENVKTEEDDGSRLGMSYNDYIVHLVGAVQEQQRMINEQQRIINKQQKQIQLLTERNELLEKHAVAMSEALNNLNDQFAAYQKQTEERMNKLTRLISLPGAV